MKTILFFAAFISVNHAFSLDISPYNNCLKSLRNDGDVMISEIDNVGVALFEKKSPLDRSLFIINAKNIYACGDVNIESSTSTAAVLNFDINLILDRKTHSLFIEIPTDLTFGAEDIVFRDSNNDHKKENLNCSFADQSDFNQAFNETITPRLRAFVLMLEESAINKKNEEISKIWGPNWKASTAINNEKNKYLKVVNKCSLVPILKKEAQKIKAKLMSIQ